MALNAYCFHHSRTASACFNDLSLHANRLDLIQVNEGFSLITIALDESDSLGRVESAQSGKCHNLEGEKSCEKRTREDRGRGVLLIASLPS
jgi:hypothetical protein